MPLQELAHTLSSPHAQVPYFVPQGWVAFVSLLLAVMVEVVRVQVAELSKRRPQEIVAVRQELATLEATVASLNPKLEFMRWARASRRKGAVAKRLEAMEADFSPSLTVVKLQQWLRFKFVVYAAMVLLWFDAPVLQMPPSWFWPLAYPMALPRHTVGTVGIVAWVAAIQPVATFVASGVERWLKAQRRANAAAVATELQRSDSGRGSGAGAGSSARGSGSATRDAEPKHKGD